MWDKIDRKNNEHNDIQEEKVCLVFLKNPHAVPVSTTQLASESE